jgi:hypothetical protein
MGGQTEGYEREGIERLCSLSIKRFGLRCYCCRGSPPRSCLLQLHTDVPSGVVRTYTARSLEYCHFRTQQLLGRGRHGEILRRLHLARHGDASGQSDVLHDRQRPSPDIRSNPLRAHAVDVTANRRHRRRRPRWRPCRPLLCKTLLPRNSLRTQTRSAVRPRAPKLTSVQTRASRRTKSLFRVSRLTLRFRIEEYWLCGALAMLSLRKLWGERFLCGDGVCMIAMEIKSLSFMMLLDGYGVSPEACVEQASITIRWIGIGLMTAY